MQIKKQLFAEGSLPPEPKKIRGRQPSSGPPSLANILKCVGAKVESSDDGDDNNNDSSSANDSINGQKRPGSKRTRRLPTWKTYIRKDDEETKTDSDEEAKRPEKRKVLSPADRPKPLCKKRKQESPPKGAHDDSLVVDISEDTFGGEAAAALNKTKEEMESSDNLAQGSAEPVNESAKEDDDAVVCAKEDFIKDNGNEVIPGQRFSCTLCTDSFKSRKRCREHVCSSHMASKIWAEHLRMLEGARSGGVELTTEVKQTCQVCGERQRSRAGFLHHMGITHDLVSKFWEESKAKASSSLLISKVVPKLQDKEVEDAEAVSVPESLSISTVSSAKEEAEEETTEETKEPLSDAPVPKAVKNRGRRISGGRRQRACLLCDEQFSTAGKSKLKLHYINEHYYDDLKDYLGGLPAIGTKCSVCDKKCSRPSGMLFHLGIVHSKVAEVASPEVRKQLETIHGGRSWNNWNSDRF